MGRQRDNKGRFVKGSEIGNENLKSFTKDNASEMGKRSVEAKRRRKLLRETLIEELEKETAKGSGLSKQEAIVAAVVKNVATVTPMTLPAFFALGMLAMAEQMEQKTIGTTTQNIRLVKMVPSQLRLDACSGHSQPKTQPAPMPSSMLMMKP